MMKSTVRYEEVASDPTAVWRIATAANHKTGMVQHQRGDFQKVMTGLQESMNRIEALVLRLANQAQTLDQTTGRYALHLRPTEEPRALPDLTQPAELEMEMTRRLEDLRQIVATGWEQDPKDSDEVFGKHEARLEDGLVVSKSEEVIDGLDCAVLGDFGIPSWLFGPSLPNPDLNQRLGTPDYMAPEQWHPNIRGPISYKTDSWSFACSILDMLSGIQPWHGKSPDEVYQLVVLKEERSIFPLPHNLPPEVKNVLSGCFKYDFKDCPLTTDTLHAFEGTKNRSLFKDTLQVGDKVCSRKLKNSCSPETMKIPHGTIVGMEDKKCSQIVRVWDPGSGSKNMRWGGPEFVMCDTTLHLELFLTFSSEGFKIENLDWDSCENDEMMGLHWEISDIICIGCKWTLSVGSALITLLVGYGVETGKSGPVRVQFCLTDLNGQGDNKRIGVLHQDTKKYGTIFHLMILRWRIGVQLLFVILERWRHLYSKICILF